MTIRRIAAAAAVALGLVAAVPGVAMASTASASGSGPQPVTVKCLPKAKQGGSFVCCPTVVVAKAVAQSVAKSGHPLAGHPIQVGCCPGPVAGKHPVAVAKPGPAPKGGQPIVVLACCAPFQRIGPAPVAACNAQPMTFDMAAFATTATEVSGPRLTAHELVFYQHQMFMISSVHGRAFTLVRLPVFARLRHQVTAGPTPFRNGGTPITDGHALVVHGPVIVVAKLTATTP
jgi:hypothetical protein